MIRLIGEYKRPMGPPVRAALLFVALLAGGFFAGRWTAPRSPQVSNGKVNVNPSKQRKQRADLVVRESLVGHGESFIPASPHPTRTVTASTPQTNWFRPGDTLEEPFTGELQARFVEEGSDAPLGEGAFQVQGTTKATFTETGLHVDTVFEGEPEIAVNLPELAPKRFEVGVLAGVGTDGQGLVGGYGRMNLAAWRLGGLEISPWVGAAGFRNRDKFVGSLLVGVGGRF